MPPVPFEYLELSDHIKGLACHINNPALFRGAGTLPVCTLTLEVICVLLAPL